MNEDTKRYLVSSLVTFLSAFLFAVAAQLSDIGTVQVTGTLIFSIISVGVRAGVKSIAELYIKTR